MAKKGRPPMSDEELYDKYVKGKEDIIAAACRNGATNEHLQKILGCGKVNFYSFKKRIHKLHALLAYNRECADLLVENSIYKRACGYEFEETTTEVVVNKDGAGSTTYVKKTKKHIPADATSAIFWLKNRKPQQWLNSEQNTKDAQSKELKPAADFLSIKPNQFDMPDISHLSDGITQNEPTN